MLGDPRASALTATSRRSGWGCALSRVTRPSSISSRTSMTTCVRPSVKRPSCCSPACSTEDRSVLDLLTADYTFVNERLAKHYGIPGIRGSEFRRVTLEGELSLAAGPARQRRDPHGVLAAGPHFAGDSRPVGAAEPPRRAGAGSASERSGARWPRPGDQAGNGKVPTMREALSAHRDKPQCAGLPQDDGSHRLRARAVRCGRPRAQPWTVAASRSTRRT